MEVKRVSWEPGSERGFEDMVTYGVNLTAPCRRSPGYKMEISNRNYPSFVGPSCIHGLCGLVFAQPWEIAFARKEQGGAGKVLDQILPSHCDSKLSAQRDLACVPEW